MMRREDHGRWFDFVLEGGLEEFQVTGVIDDLFLENRGE